MVCGRYPLHCLRGDVAALQGGWAEWIAFENLSAGLNPHAPITRSHQRENSLRPGGLTGSRYPGGVATEGLDVGADPAQGRNLIGKTEIDRAAWALAVECWMMEQAKCVEALVDHHNAGRAGKGGLPHRSPFLGGLQFAPAQGANRWRREGNGAEDVNAVEFQPLNGSSCRYDHRCLSQAIHRHRDQQRQQGLCARP